MWAIVFAAVLGTTLVLLLVAMSDAVSRVTRSATRPLRCPIDDRQVTVEFQEEVWDGSPVDVTSCTAFAPATAIACGKPCLRFVRLRTLRKAGMA